MKQFLSVILAVVLVVSVSGSVVNGTMAQFFDTEVSTGNEMTSGTLLIKLIGGPIEAECASPCKWYTADMEVVNCGTRDGIAYLQLENIANIEDEVGEGVATSEPELVAEEGGQVGETTVAGLGVDCGADTGPPDWVISKHVDIEIWFDKNGDGEFVELDDELIVQGKLGELPPDIQWELGMLPADANEINGGWATYFDYYADSETLLVPLIAGQTIKVGWVSVWNVGDDLHVTFDTSESGWGMDETALYVGAEPPTKHSPGLFPYKHEDLDCATTDEYTVPLGGLTHVYIATHAAGCDEETAWAMGGPPRKLRVKLHMQDVPEAYFGYDYFDETDPDIQLKCWDHWPTNAYQGDICQFDMKFILNQDSSYRHWRWQSGNGWSYRLYNQ